ncbi:UbiA family prenyltransferase, partial [Mesorhizobium sp. M2E.F.Ca.ET.219.01.1.1]|uniref:UbiA family prenyltransferase n=1 Tax=Mesorhizobium sp. M2E.F.Ca.ET.219.01.1.1 TaxID=2500530 RepID=UPI001FE12077
AAGCPGGFQPHNRETADANKARLYSAREESLLFLIIFLWTPPHFWALALFKSDDYARAGIPMMPNVAGHASTRRQIFGRRRSRPCRRRCRSAP